MRRFAASCRNQAITLIDLNFDRRACERRYGHCRIRLLRSYTCLQRGTHAPPVSSAAFVIPENLVGGAGLEPATSSV
jgi:hypothetical protein